MTEPITKVADDVVVAMNYTLRLDDGQIVDSSEGREALAFLQGRGQIIPGLEQELYGMEVGSEKEVVVEPADGYGEVNPEARQLVPRDAFPAEMQVTSGAQVQVQDQQGQVHTARIATVEEDGVVLDFNHPLAGETLYFHVQIDSLRQATAEELAHGHTHA